MLTKVPVRREEISDADLIHLMHLQEVRYNGDQGMVILEASRLAGVSSERVRQLLRHDTVVSPFQAVISRDTGDQYWIAG